MWPWNWLYSLPDSSYTPRDVWSVSRFSDPRVCGRVYQLWGCQPLGASLWGCQPPPPWRLPLPTFVTLVISSCFCSFCFLHISVSPRGIEKRIKTEFTLPFSHFRRKRPPSDPKHTDALPGSFTPPGLTVPVYVTVCSSSPSCHHLCSSCIRRTTHLLQHLLHRAPCVVPSWTSLAILTSTCFLHSQTWQTVLNVSTE